MRRFLQGSSSGTAGAGLTPEQEAALAGAAQTSENLADMADPTACRDHIGLGSMAVQDASAVTITGGTSAASPTKVVTATYLLAAAGVYQSYGIAQPSVQGGSPTLVIADGCRFEQRTSTTTLGATAGTFSVSPLILSSDIAYTAYFRVRTGASLTNDCVYVGIGAAQPTFSSATPPLNSSFARFVQGVDTKFTAFGRAAGSASAGAPFGPNIATSTTYMIRIRNVPGVGAYFAAYAGTAIDGDFGNEVIVATVPAAGVGLGWVAQAGAFTAGTAVTFAWSLTQLEW